MRRLKDYLRFVAWQIGIGYLLLWAVTFWTLDEGAAVFGKSGVCYPDAAKVLFYWVCEATSPLAILASVANVALTATVWAPVYLAAATVAARCHHHRRTDRRLACDRIAARNFRSHPHDGGGAGSAAPQRVGPRPRTTAGGRSRRGRGARRRPAGIADRGAAAAGQAAQRIRIAQDRGRPPQDGALIASAADWSSPSVVVRSQSADRS